MATRTATQTQGLVTENYKECDRLGVKQKTEDKMKRRIRNGNINVNSENLQTIVIEYFVILLMIQKFL